MCLVICAPTWAANRQFDFWYDYNNNHYEQTYVFTGDYSIFDLYNSRGQRFLYAVSCYPFTYSDTRYNYVDKAVDYRTASDGKRVYYKEIVYHPDNSGFSLPVMNISSLDADEFGTTNYVQYLADNIDTLGFNNLPGVNGSGGEISGGYSPAVPAPANVRYVKTGEDTAGLVWDNNDTDDKYHVVIRGVFHWKNNNPVGSWIQNNTPFTGDSSGDVTVQLLDSSDQYKVSRSGYSIPDDKFEEVKATVAKEAKQSATWWSWYPSEFQVQYFGYDENGKKIFGDAAICKINWSNVKKGEWTSSTMIYSGGVKDDTGAGGEQSTTHVTDWGEVMGGGGASWDDSNEYDSSGNIVKSDASKNTLQDFINGLVNIPDILNRFFQTIQVLMSGISQLPALFSTIVSYMPPEFVSLLGMGLVVVIILRIFGR